MNKVVIITGAVVCAAVGWFGNQVFGPKEKPRADCAYSVYRLPVLPNLGEVLMTPSCAVGDVP